MASSGRHGPSRRTRRDSCDHCGRAVRSAAVVTTLRRASVVFCDAGCHDDHVVLVALSAARCTAAGCDLDAVADVPFCDEHLTVLAA